MKITQIPSAYESGWNGYAPLMYEVQCEMHQEKVKFTLGAIELAMDPNPQELIMINAATALRKDCPGCSIPPTRWPNAGEPGGAEL